MQEAQIQDGIAQLLALAEVGPGANSEGPEADPMSDLWEVAFPMRMVDDATRKAVLGEVQTWICLDCARAGGRQNDCRGCWDSKVLTARQKSDAAVASLVMQFRREKKVEEDEYDRMERLLSRLAQTP